MRLVLSNSVYAPLGIALVTKLILCSEAFSPSYVRQASFGLSRNVPIIQHDERSTSVGHTELFAKKKAKKIVANLDFDFLDDDEPMSAKDKMKLEKQKAKEAKNVEAQQEDAAQTGKKDRKAAALKALEDMERMEAQMAAQDTGAADEPKLSKKEQKALKKKLEKEAAKKAAKEAKKAARAAAGEDVSESAEGVPDLIVNDAGPVDAAPEEEKPKGKLTLEERIRKERPPPRVRVMESSQPNYSSLRLENIGITFRDQQVLKDVTWEVRTGDRIGLVGHNGAGKTTQLRIMSGEMEPTTGDVIKSGKDLRVAMLKQEFVDELVPDRTLKEEFMSVFGEELKILTDLRDAEDELANLAADDAETMQSVLDRMQELQSKADSSDVYTLESRAKKVMNLMGFEEDEEDYLVAMFSGGWKMRIGLGKVLLNDPNILLLDEPTNHLDLESVEWLEAFLVEQNIPMVIVSHDREFLDKVCNKIVDAEGGICSVYDNSNYSRFLELKKARMDTWQATYNAQEKKIKEERKWIQKFKIKQPQACKQRAAQLDKLVKSDSYVQKPPFFGKPFKFRFPDAPRLSPEVGYTLLFSNFYCGILFCMLKQGIDLNLPCISIICRLLISKV